MPDENIETNDEPIELTEDEKRLATLSARGKRWNNHSLFYFGCAVVWLLLLKYADLEPMIGAVSSVLLLMFTMALAVISVILSAFFTWHARILRKEIEYYSTDPEPERLVDGKSEPYKDLVTGESEDTGQTEIPE